MIAEEEASRVANQIEAGEIGFRRLSRDQWPQWVHRLREEGEMTREAISLMLDCHEDSFDVELADVDEHDPDAGE